MGAFEAVLMAYYVPEFYRRVSSDSETQQSEAWNLYASAILPSLLLTAFFVALFASPLTKLLLGSRFHDVAVYTMFGAAAELARTYAGAYGLIAHARMKTRLLLIPYGLGAVVAVGLVFALVPTFGLLGVAAALVASSWCGVLGMHWSMRRQLRISLPFSLTAEALVYAAVLALLAWGSTFISIDSSIGLFISVKAFLTVGLAGLAYLGFQYRLLRRPISQLKVGRA
jgi:O-antigen/teichoic acid export membrane protein